MKSWGGEVLMRELVALQGEDREALLFLHAQEAGKAT